MNHLRNHTARLFGKTLRFADDHTGNKKAEERMNAQP